MALSGKIEQTFVESVKEYFSYLPELYRIRGPIILKQSPLSMEIGYIGERISIVLILSVRDELVDCQIRQTINGVPAGYGQGSQEYLYTLLWRKGVPKEELKVKIQKNISPEEKIREIVRHCAYLIYKYSNKILTRD